jgi:hypothetical protein
MRTAIVAALLLAPALPAAAHHSFSAEFDSTKQVTLDGQVVMMEWVNPHSWLHIDVKKADGSLERWKIEGGSPSVLMRLGWDRNSLPAGTRVTVVGFQAKDGSLRASSRDLRFPDGRHVFLEINPAGQFLFVEYFSGQPIAATLARVLHEADQRA